MSSEAAGGFYARRTWDVAAWVDVIAVEYETLIRAYPFNQALSALSAKGPVHLLDIGCGTAIFPGFLDKVLDDSVHFQCDLLDISEASLSVARKRLNAMDHFSVSQTYRTAIEAVPAVLASRTDPYDVIWAIHSFTTVDVGQMERVYAAVLGGLRPGGLLYVYQLAAESSYQALHSFYRERHPSAGSRRPFMEFEDSRRILDRLGAAYEVYPQRFDHQVPVGRPDLLEKYLRKSVLDESLNATQFFEPLLDHFHDPKRGVFAFPQAVNFIVVRP